MSSQIYGHTLTLVLIGVAVRRGTDQGAVGDGVKRHLAYSLKCASACSYRWFDGMRSLPARASSTPDFAHSSDVAPY